MKKNLYRKPYMAIEQFVPNAYVADCWYVAPGDCYDDLYADMYKSTRHEYDDGEHIVQNHGSHRIPDNGFFNSETQPEPNEPIDYQYYIYTDEYGPGIGEDYIAPQYYGGPCYFVNVKPLVLEHEGVTHYLKNISYSPNRNQS